MKFSILAVLGLFSITISSCDQKIKAERMKQIDSLGTHLNHVHEVVNSVDSTIIENRLNDIERTGNWVLENVSDTLPRKSGLQFGDHLRCKKYYDKALTRYSEVKKELQYSEHQLQTLRNAVKANFYSDEEFNGYFSTEAESIKKLVEATDGLENNYGLANEQFQHTKPIVTAMIDSIKNVIYSPEPIRKK